MASLNHLPAAHIIDKALHEKDVEKGVKGPESSETSSEVWSVDTHLVSWDGINDPTNPRNWSLHKKWLITFLTSAFAFISPVSSSMVGPGLATIALDFGISNQVVVQMNLSVFVLAYAIGPLVLGPLSELYGRVPVLQLANLEYLIFNAACGAARNEKEMIAFRFLAGIGGSALGTLGGGILVDMWGEDERGCAISMYTLMPLLGLALGPIAGGYITQYWTWRWSFFLVSFAAIFIQILAILFLRETYPRKLLGDKVRRLSKETGSKDFHTKFDNEDDTLLSKLKTALTRPFLIGTQLIVQVLALYMAFLYGLIYLVLSTFPRLWVGKYHQSTSIGGWNYISAAIGFYIGAQSSCKLMDLIYKKLKKGNDGVGRPEYRVLLMIPGAAMVPLGIFIYGWCAQNLTFWLWPNIGVALVSAGMIMCNQCMQAYLVDAYTQYAASALAAAAVVRSMTGFGFPLFAPDLYDALGYGWGNSILGFLAIGIGWPAPIILWKYGHILRERSTFGTGE